MQRLALATLFCVTHAVDFSSFLGTWSPVNKSTPHAILGPSGLLQTFTMSKNDLNGDHWMSAIPGQVFRIRDGKMQYCFARMASSPFVVDSSTTKSKIVFCYKTGERMDSHRMLPNGLATGCEAAKIVLELHNDGIMEFTFFMSPPVKHAWVEFRRRGPAPPISYYKVTDVFGTCDPEHPPPPTLGTGSTETKTTDQLSSMCPIASQKDHASLGEVTAEMAAEVTAEMAASTADLGMKCLQLGTFLAGILAKESVDIRFQFHMPFTCWPCKVSYSVSAKISEGQYIAVGFKGMGYRFYEGMIPGSHKGGPRPNYFGMGTDKIDETRTGSVIAVGYSAGGGCVREMKAEEYVGAPSNVDGNPHLFDTSVERRNGRTVFRFAVEQYAGKTPLEVHNFFYMQQQAQRVMWAIGDVRTGPAPAPTPVAKFKCKVCSHIYDPDMDGDGMAFEDLPDTWVCPVCGQPKSVYEPVTLDAPASLQGDCKEEISMHMRGQRGVSPISWLGQHPRCLFDAAEFGRTGQGDVANGSAPTLV